MYAKHFTCCPTGYTTILNHNVSNCRLSTGIKLNFLAHGRIFLPFWQEYHERVSLDNLNVFAFLDTRQCICNIAETPDLYLL